MDVAGTLTVDVSRAGGLVKLTKDPIIDIEVDHLAFQVTRGALAMSVSGTVTPLFRKNEINWPHLKVEKMTIDSHGDITVEGGWIDVPKQASVSFFGFTLELTKIGFGTEDDGKRWVGMSARSRWSAASRRAPP